MPEALFPEWDEETTIPDAVLQAVGYAYACWTNPACDYVRQPDSAPEPPSPVDYEEVTITLRWKLPVGTRHQYGTPVTTGQVGDIAGFMITEGHEPFFGRLEVTGPKGNRTVYSH